ncbi:MAG: zinc ribbon domain-containing protein [Deltaproteobacteria bacterium]|nr:zinc ribbon domain-containing protein [Deltaproteobacteria bacterium]
MPIFEYHCKKCGNQFEELVFNREEKPPCPKCSSTKVAKQMSTFAHHGGGGNGGGDVGPGSGGGSGCSSCSGGSCSTCG